MKNTSIFLGILNHFMHQESPVPDTSALTSEEIVEMLSFSGIHSIFPVIYDVLRTAPAFSDLPDALKSTYQGQMRQLVIGQTMRTANFLHLYRIIRDSGISPLVLKGIVLRNLYQQSDYRASGDEDILVKKEDFFTLDKILVSQGFLRNLGENPLSEHEITYSSPRYRLNIEVHLSLFPADSEAYGHLNSNFSDVFENSVTETIQGVEIATLSPTHHMLYLICHALKHFLHSGFGIRQVSDMVLFSEHYGSEIDWNSIISCSKENNFYVFWMNLFEIGEKNLGFSWERSCLEKPKKFHFDTEPLLNDLLDGGVYGKSSENRVHSSNMTLQAFSGEKSKNSLFSSLFPSYSYMKVKYPILEHRRYLLPFMWVRRIFDYLKHSNRKDIRETMSTGHSRVELLKKYDLIRKK